MVDTIDINISGKKIDILTGSFPFLPKELNIKTI